MPGEPVATLLKPLPEDATAFVGRREALGELRRMMDQARLLTLTGPGGTGKTRLALHLARGVQERFSDGVVLVEYGAVRPGPAVSEAVMEALGVAAEPDMTGPARLAQHLRDREMLLLLDNCEHVVEDVAQLAASLLRFAPRVRILATSREPLAVAGEIVWAVPPLTVPGSGATSQAIEQSEAVRLFVDRAQAADPTFALDDDNASAVGAICRQLDGIPMAIELAAARIRALSPSQIQERLSDRFRLLASHSRTLVPRQQTLRALIDWSYDLLSEPERAVWRRMSVFVGGFTLEAAEWSAAGDDVEATDVLDLVSQLVDKSVFTRSGPERPERYRMLESIRTYGVERLREAGEEDGTLRRFLDFYVQLVRTNLAREKSDHRNDVPAGWSGEWPNMQAAAQVALRLQDREAAAAIAVGTAGLGLMGSRFAEAERLLRDLLELSRELETEEWAGAEIMLGTILGIRDPAGGEWRPVLEEGVRVARQIKSDYALGAGLNNLGVRLRDVGELEDAEACFAEAYRVWPHPLGLLNLAVIRLTRDDEESWRRLVDQAEEEANRKHDRRTAGFALLHRAEHAVRRREWAQAFQFLDAAERTMPPEERYADGELSGARALFLALTGDSQGALAQVTDFPPLAAYRLTCAATLLAASQCGWHHDVAVLTGILERTAEGPASYMRIEDDLREAQEQARTALGDSAWEALVREGSSLRGDDRGQAVLAVVARRSVVGAPSSDGDSMLDGAPLPEARPAEPPRHTASDADELAVVEGLSHLKLEELSVVGAYRRYDERVRNQLRDWHRRLVAPILRPTLVHENFLIWAAPGSGKSFLIQESARALGPAVQYVDINLARLSRDEFVARLAAVRAAEGPVLCLLDEIDARAGESWPYEECFSLLDLNLEADRQAVFVLVGSHPGGMAAMTEAIRSRSKGTDLLDRVPMNHRFEIPPPTIGDRLAIAAGQILEAARLRSDPVEEVEKLALYYALRDEALQTPRQLRDLAVAAVQNLPPGERRLKYDDLFYRGDTRSKEFWSQNPAARGLADRFIRLAV